MSASPRDERLPLLLVPTTAGTGSEVTPIAIVTTPTTEKKGVVSPRLLPDWAILDPELTLGLPSHVTAATGIDAMVHAIEAYTSRHKKNPMSDQLARQALALLSQNIREVCRNGQNLEARSQMLLGSMLAGMAFANAPVAAVHALAYPIGAIFHVPHGLSNALVLWACCASTCRPPRRFMRSWRPSSIPRPPVFLSARRHRASWRASPPSAATARCRHRWRRSGFGESDLPRLAEDAMKQTRLLVNNPREVTYADAFAIYGEALDGKRRPATA